MRTRLLYALHSGNLYGTERMALATAQALADEFAPTLLAPDGPALREAQRLGFDTCAFASPQEFFRRLGPRIACEPRVALIATGVVHSLAAVAWNLVYGRPLVHLHVVHGGAAERDSYGRKRILNRTGVVLVAVSGFVRERLIANGVAADRIVVIENFLPDAAVAGALRRSSFSTPGIRRVVVVSRIDPQKRIDLLLDALDGDPALGALEVRVLGDGWDLGTLRLRAAARNPGVTFVGFTPRVAEELAAADLLVHLCPVEPFGLAILEAMAAGVPALVPDTGGAGSLVADGVSGFHFRADDARALAARLRELASTSPERLNAIVEGGRRALASRFSALARSADYRRLLHGEMVTARKAA